MKKIISIATAVFAVSAMSSTDAVHAQTPSWYGGVAYGQSKSNVNAGEVNDFLRSVGYGSPSTSVDDKDKAYRFVLGYRLSPAVALEAFYADLGNYGSRSNVATPFIGSVSADYSAKGFGVDLILSAPLTDVFSVYGRLGVIQAKTEASFSSSGSVALLRGGGSKNKTGPHFGVGLQYEISPTIGLRGEVETYRKLGDESTGGELKVDAISLGAIFRF